MNKNFPSLSILTLTFNPDLKTFERSLESIKNQNYPAHKIEHLILDGGSTSKTITLAKKYNCIPLIKPELRNQSEERRAFGVNAAKNEIILWLESDNILTNSNSLRELIKPFLEDKKIIATYSLHYAYNERASMLNKYCGLFGNSDPVVLYLNKNDREPWYMDKYKKGKIIQRNAMYDTVEFNEQTLPTVGDNGFLVKRKILLKAQIKPQEYFHTDVFIDLIRMGYSRFGIVHSVAVEHIVGDSILRLVRRRVEYMKRYAEFEALSKRRYAILNLQSKKDILGLAKYIFLTVTILQPLYLSIKGYSKIRDLAWFIHPLICYMFLLYYFKSVIEKKFITR